ncbi:MAG: hypothetical protein DHS20C01_20250 [marine bacterium B5-7]|nr:MAG: hypothetical protein DHS20C01_20250 [marine bacterium B5-7]
MSRRLPAAVAIMLLAITISEPGLTAETTNTSTREAVLRYLDRVVNIVPGVGLDKVRIGAPIASVPQLWGEPYRHDRSGIIKRRTTLVYKSDTDTYIQVTGDKTVEEIGVQGRNGFSTPEGVAYGMPEYQVHLIYGQPDEIVDNQQRYTTRGLGIVYKSGTVYQMIVFAREDNPKQD